MTDSRPRPEGTVPVSGSDGFVDTLTAAMPPSLARGQQLSTDELVAEMNRIPLFMTSLDETDGGDGENVLLEALKALAVEGTRSEVAENFRTQGNEAARARLWRDAREFYTKGISTLRGQIKTVDAPQDPNMKIIEEPDPEEEAKREKVIEEACLANRALCELEMKNYGSCNRDCAETLRLNPRNVKAWYRAASACLALDKIPEGLDACQSGLQFDSENAALQRLLTKIQQRKSYLVDQAKAREAREQKARDDAATLSVALRQRKIPTRKTDSPPEMEDATIQLSDPNDAASLLAFPVLYLYPLHAQTDFVKAVQEDETLGQHLEYILPTPWDHKHEYTAEYAECYMETRQGGLIKAGKKLPLLKLLSSGKIEVVDGLVRVFVVPASRAKEWIEQFKARRGKS